MYVPGAPANPEVRSNRNDTGSATSLSAGATAGITLVVSLPVGVVIGLGVAWCVWRYGQGSTSESPQQNIEQLQGAIYEEPQEIAIPLGDNQAYGHVNTQLQLSSHHV